MANDTAYSKLDLRQKKFVTLFCKEGQKCYLDKVESYRTAGYATRGTHVQVAMNANKLYNKPFMQAAVKEMLPKVAFDQLFIRTEMKDLYNTSKADGELKLRKEILVEMAKIEGLYDKKVDKSENVADYKEHVNEAQKQWEEMKKKLGIDEKDKKVS